MNFVVVGAPLSGKGTISKKLSAYLNIPHISTGNLLRDLANSNSKEISSYVSEKLKTGDLFPDEFIYAVLENRLEKSDCKNGVILDGFPRTLTQAEWLDSKFKIDFAIYTTVSNATILQRLSKRLVCPSCNTVYNIDGYDKNYCDKCKTTLVRRADDNEEVLLKRINNYNKITFPILDAYLKQNKLVTVANEGSIDVVFNELLRKLKIWLP